MPVESGGANPWFPWVEAALAAMLAVIGYFGKRLVKKVDDLAENKADKTDLKALDDRLTAEAEELKRETREEIAGLRRDQVARDERIEQKLDDGFRSIHERIDKLYERSARRG